MSALMLVIAGIMRWLAASGRAGPEDRSNPPPHPDYSSSELA
jgi:hypothetical protein